MKFLKIVKNVSLSQKTYHPTKMVAMKKLSLENSVDVFSSLDVGYLGIL